MPVRFLLLSLALVMLSGGQPVRSGPAVEEAPVARLVDAR